MPAPIYATVAADKPQPKGALGHGSFDFAKLPIGELRMRLAAARTALKAMKDYHATTRAGPLEKREGPMKRHQDLVEALEVEVAAREDSAAAAPAVMLGRRRGARDGAGSSVEESIGRTTQAAVDEILELCTQLDPLQVADVCFGTETADDARRGVTTSAAAAAAAALAKQSSSTGDLGFLRWLVLTLNDADLAILLVLHPRCPPPVIEAVLAHAPNEFFSLLSQDDAASIFSRCLEHRLRATTSLLLSKLPTDAIISSFGDSNTTSDTSATRLMLQAMQYGWTELVECVFSSERIAVACEHDNWSRPPQQRQHYAARSAMPPSPVRSRSDGGGPSSTTSKKGAAASGGAGQPTAPGRALWPEVPPAAFHFLIQTNRMLMEASAAQREAEAASEGDAILSAAARTMTGERAGSEAPAASSPGQPAGAAGTASPRGSSRALLRAAAQGAMNTASLAEHKTAAEIPERGLLYDPDEHEDTAGAGGGDFGDFDGNASPHGRAHSIRGFGDSFRRGAQMRRGSRISVGLTADHLEPPSILPAHSTVHLFRPSPMTVAPVPRALHLVASSLVGQRAAPRPVVPQDPQSAPASGDRHHHHHHGHGATDSAMAAPPSPRRGVSPAQDESKPSSGDRPSSDPTQPQTDHQDVLAAPLIKLPLCDSYALGDDATSEAADTPMVAPMARRGSRHPSPRDSGRSPARRGRSATTKRRGNSPPQRRRSPDMPTPKAKGDDSSADQPETLGRAAADALAAVGDFPVTVRADTPVYRSRTYFSMEVPIALLALPNAHEVCRFGWCRGSFEATGCYPALIGADPEGNSFGISLELYRPKPPEPSPTSRSKSPSGRGGGGRSPRNAPLRTPGTVTKTTTVTTTLGGGPASPSRNPRSPRPKAKEQMKHSLRVNAAEQPPEAPTIRDREAAARLFPDDSEQTVKALEDGSTPWRFLVRKHYRGTTMPIGTSAEVNLIECGTDDKMVTLGLGLDTYTGEASFSANLRFLGVAFDGFVIPEGAGPACAWYPAASLHATLSPSASTLPRAEQFNLLSSLAVTFSFAQSPPCLYYDPDRARIARRRRRRTAAARRALSIANGGGGTAGPESPSPSRPRASVADIVLAARKRTLTVESSSDSDGGEGDSASPVPRPGTGRGSSATLATEGDSDDPTETAQSKAAMALQRDNEPGVVKVVEAPWGSLTREHKVEHVWRVLAAYSATLAATQLSSSTMSGLVGTEEHEVAKEATQSVTTSNRFARTVLDVVERKKTDKSFDAGAQAAGAPHNDPDLAVPGDSQAVKAMRRPSVVAAGPIANAGWPSELTMITLPADTVTGFIAVQRAAVDVLNELDLVRPHLTPALLDADTLIDGAFYGIFGQRPTDVSLLPQLPSGPDAPELDSESDNENDAESLTSTSDDDAVTSPVFATDVASFTVPSPTFGNVVASGHFRPSRPANDDIFVPDGDMWDAEVQFPALEAAAEPFPRDSEEALPLSWAPAVVRYLTVLKRLRQRRKSMHLHHGGVMSSPFANRHPGSSLAAGAGGSRTRPPFRTMHRPMEPLPMADFPDVLPFIAAKTAAMKAPPLCACLRYNFVGMARVLASVPSVNVNLPDEHGFTALMLAVMSGQFEMLRYLLFARDAAVAPMNYSGYTAMHLALLHDRDEAVRILLSHPSAVTPELLDAQTPSKSNCVALAVKKARPDLVRAFLRRGANATTPDKNNITPLLFACRVGMYDIVDMLLSSGQYDGGAGNSNAPVSQRERRQPRGSPLLYAALDGNQSICQRLLRCGAVGRVGFEPFSVTPVHAAVHSGNLDCAAFLIGSRACDPSAVETHTNSSALHFVMERGLHALVVLALNTPGVDPNIQNKSGHTPLMLAVLHGHTECANTFVSLTKRKLRIEAIDKGGNTALTIAAQCGNVPVVETLIDVAHADTNFVNQAGHSPLQAAIHFGHPKAAEAMIHFGKQRLDFEMKRAHVPRAIELAVARGYIRLCRLMLAHGTHASQELTEFINAPEHDPHGPSTLPVPERLLSRTPSQRRDSTASRNSTENGDGSSRRASNSRPAPLNEKSLSDGRDAPKQRPSVASAFRRSGEPPEAVEPPAEDASNPHVPSLVRRLSAAPPPPVAPPKIAASQADLGINREPNPFRCFATGRTRSTVAVLAHVLFKLQQPTIAINSANMALMAKAARGTSPPAIMSPGLPPTSATKAAATPAAGGGSSVKLAPSQGMPASREATGSVPLRNVTALLDIVPTGADAVAMLELVTKPGRDRNGDVVDRHAPDPALAAAMSPRKGQETSASPVSAQSPSVSAAGLTSPAAAADTAVPMPVRSAYQHAWRVVTEAFSTVNPSCTSETAVRAAAQAALRVIRQRLTEETGRASADRVSQPFAIEGRSATTQVFATEGVGYEFGVDRGVARMFELLRQRATSEKLADARRRYDVTDLTGSLSCRGVTMLHIGVLTGNESATEFLVEGGAAFDFTLLVGAECPTRRQPGVQRIVAEGAFSQHVDLLPPDAPPPDLSAPEHAKGFAHELLRQSSRAALARVRELNDSLREHLIDDMVRSPPELVDRAHHELIARCRREIESQLVAAETDPFESIETAGSGAMGNSRAGFGMSSVPQFSFVPAALARHDTVLSGASESAIFNDEFSARKGRTITASVEQFVVTSPLLREKQVQQLSMALLQQHTSPVEMERAITNCFDEAAAAETEAAAAAVPEPSPPASQQALAAMSSERILLKTSGDGTARTSSKDDDSTNKKGADDVLIYDSALVCACKTGAENVVRIMLLTAVNAPTAASNSPAAAGDLMALGDSAAAGGLGTMSFPLGRVALPTVERLRVGLLTMWDGPFIAAPMRHLRRNIDLRDGRGVKDDAGKPRAGSAASLTDRSGSGSSDDPFAQFGSPKGSRASSRQSSRPTSPSGEAARAPRLSPFAATADIAIDSRTSPKVASIVVESAEDAATPTGDRGKELVFDFGSAIGFSRRPTAAPHEPHFPKVTTRTLLHLLIETPGISDRFIIEVVQLLDIEFTVTSVSREDIEAIADERTGPPPPAAEGAEEGDAAEASARYEQRRGIERQRIATRFSALAWSIRHRRMQLTEWALDNDMLPPQAFAHDVVWLLTVHYLPDLLPALLVLWRPEEVGANVPEDESAVMEQTTGKNPIVDGNAQPRAPQPPNTTTPPSASPASVSPQVRTLQAAAPRAAAASRRAEGGPSKQKRGGRQTQTSVRAGAKRVRMTVAAATAAVVAGRRSKDRLARRASESVDPNRQPASVALYAALLHRVLDLPRAQISPLLELLCVELLVQHPEVRWDLPEQGANGPRGRSLLAQASWRQTFRVLEYLIRVALPTKPDALVDVPAESPGDCPLTLLQRAEFRSADLGVAVAICDGVVSARDRRVFVESVARRVHPAVLARLTFVVKPHALSLPPFVAGSADAGAKGLVPHPPSNAAASQLGLSALGGSSMPVPTPTASRRRSIGFSTPAQTALPKAADASAVEPGEAARRLFMSVLYLCVAGSGAHRGPSLSKQVENIRPQTAILAAPFVVTCILALYGHTDASRRAVRQSLPSHANTAALGPLPVPSSADQTAASGGHTGGGSSARGTGNRSGKGRSRAPAGSGVRIIVGDSVRPDQDPASASVAGASSAAADQQYSAPRLGRKSLKPSDAPKSAGTSLWAAAGAVRKTPRRGGAAGALGLPDRIPSATLSSAAGRALLLYVCTTTFATKPAIFSTAVAGGDKKPSGSITSRTGAIDPAWQSVHDLRIALFHLVQRTAFGTNARASVPLSWRLYAPAASEVLGRIRQRVDRITPNALRRGRGGTGDAGGDAAAGSSTGASDTEMEDIDDEDVDVTSAASPKQQAELARFDGAATMSSRSESRPAPGTDMSSVFEASLGVLHAQQRELDEAAAVAARQGQLALPTKLEAVAEKALDVLHQKLFQCIADITATYVTAELTTGLNHLSGPLADATAMPAGESERVSGMGGNASANGGAVTLAVSIAGPATSHAGGAPGKDRQRRPSVVAAVVDFKASTASDQWFGRGLAWLAHVMVQATKSGTVDVLEVIRWRIAQSERRTRDDLRPGQVGQIPTGINRRLADLAAFRHFHPLPTASAARPLGSSVDPAAASQSAGANDAAGEPERLAREVLAPTDDMLLPSGEHDDELLFRGNLFGHFPHLFYSIVVHQKLPFVAAAQKRAHVLEYLLVNPSLAKMRDEFNVPIIDYVVRDIGSDASRESLRAASLCVQVLLRARAPLSLVALECFRRFPAYFPVGTMTAAWHGDTLLHTAAINNQMDVVNSLLDDATNRGRYVLTRNRYGFLPWQYAVGTSVLRRVIEVTVSFATMADALLEQYRDAKGKMREAADAQSSAVGGATSGGFGATNLASLALAALALAQETHETDREPDLFVSAMFGDDDEENDEHSDPLGESGKKRSPTMRVMHSGAPLVDFNAAVVSLTFLETHIGKSAALGLNINKHAPTLDQLSGDDAAAGGDGAFDAASVVNSIAGAPGTIAPGSPLAASRQQTNANPAGLSTSAGMASSVFASADASQTSKYKTLPADMVKELWRRCFVCEAEDRGGQWTNRPSHTVLLKVAMSPAAAARRLLSIFASPYALQHSVAGVVDARREAEQRAAREQLGAFDFSFDATLELGEQSQMMPPPPLHPMPPAKDKDKDTAAGTSGGGAPTGRTKSERKGESAPLPPILGATSPLALLQLLLPRVAGVVRPSSNAAEVSADDVAKAAAGAEGTAVSRKSHLPTSVTAAQEALANLIGVPFDDSASHRFGYPGAAAASNVGGLPTLAEWNSVFLLPCEVVRINAEQRRRLHHVLLDVLQQTLFTELGIDTGLAPLYDHARDEED